MLLPNNQMGHMRRWYKLQRCSICKSFIWLSQIELKEPAEAPEPHQVWQLCESCYDALLIEIRRAAIRSPERLRIALGIVASERSPGAYALRETPEGQQFRREFIWFTWFIIFFGLLHLVVFAIIWLH